MVGLVVLIAWNYSQLISQESEVNLDRGPYEVGVRMVEKTDFSRSFGKNQGRPMRILIWYPSEVGIERITLSDYLSRSRTDMSTWKNLFNDLGADVDTTRILDWESLSYRESRPRLERKFPLAVYSPGAYGDEFENLLLCEYLASHGYVVAAHYSLGPDSEWTKISAQGLESQARDIEFTINVVQESIVTADIANLGLIGWSWGGLASMLVQMRNQNVDGVVSLDGSMALHSDKASTTAFFNPQNVTVPYLFVGVNRTHDELTSFLSKIKYSDGYYLQYKYLQHHEFSSLDYLGRLYSGNNIGPEDEKKRRSYEKLITTTIRFFDRALKDSVEGILDREIDSNLVVYRRLEPLPRPPKTEEFFEIFKNQGLEKSKEVFDRVYSNDSTFLLFMPDEAIELAYTLHSDLSQNEKAVELLKMSLKLYPGYYKTYGHLGNILRRANQLEDALTYFSMAYGMVTGIESGFSKAAKQDLEWYSKSIERIKSKIK